MNRKKHFTMIIYAALIFLIMALSIVFRIAAGKTVEDEWGYEYCDPETDLPFLTEMDSYYHLRMTEDIVKYGHPGESVVGKENWDDLSYAPNGRSADDYRPLMAYSAVYIHRLLSIFADVSIYQVIFYLGAVLSALVVIPVFIIAHRMGGPLAGVAASVLAALNYGYFIHTVPGFYDTDMVISFASCLMFCFCIILVYEKKFIYGFLMGLSLVGLYLSWNAYSLYVGILVASLLVTLFLKIVIKRERKNTPKKEAKSFINIILAIALLTIIIDPGIFKSVISYAGSVFAPSSSLFPDAYVSVSEMRKPSVIAGGFSGLFQMKVLSESNIGIINSVGGSLAFLAAVFVWIMMILYMIKREIRFEYVLMAIWLPVTAVLAFRSWRFIVLFAVPVAILTGVFVGKLWELMKEKKLMDRQIFIGMVMAVMLFPALFGTYKSLSDSAPVLNTYINDTVTYVRDNTTKDTIIASWWDYGYYFEQKADRRTLFDGGSQNGMRVFWVGRALSTEDERLSANIFRMLAGSGDTATEKMTEIFGENKETLNIMLEILAGDRAGAKDILAKHDISENGIVELVNLMFPDPVSPVKCFITPDMSGICGWFYDFGYWNENGKEKASDYRVIISGADYDPVDGKSAWRFKNGNNEAELYIEENAGSYSAYTTTGGSEKGQQPVPIDRIIVRENGSFRTELMKDVQKSDHSATVFINLDAGQPSVSVMPDRVMDSVFGKLFYLDGEGLSQYVGDPNAPGSIKVYDMNF